MRYFGTKFCALIRLNKSNSNQFFYIVAKYNEKGAANEHEATLSDSFVFIDGHKFRNNIRSTTSVPTGLTNISLLPSFCLVKRLQVVDP